MDLTEQKELGQNSITIFDSLNASLMSIKICPQEGVVAPNSNDLVISVGDVYAILNSPKAQYKNYVYNLSRPLCYSETNYGEFHQEVSVINNEIKMRAYVEWSDDYGTTIEELEPIDLVLFYGKNIISTNYQNVDIELIYPKNNDFNKCFLNTSIHNTHNKINDSLSLDNLYFKDAFTKIGNELNEEIDNLKVKCITSKDNKFSLDSDGNLTVNSITTNSNESLSNINQNIIRDFIYPIGSIYMSVNDINPTTLFGGTWEQLKDRFLLGAGDIYSNGNMAGEANHILTISELPNHNHNVSIYNSGAHTHTTIGRMNSGSGGSSIFESFAGYGSSRNVIVYSDGSEHTHNVSQNNVGENCAHNNMPPYITVNMWKRVA